MEFPIKFYRNDRWFANLEWYLFKYLHIKRKIPCGQTKQDDFLCCRQPYNVERVYFNEDKTECYCKVCDKMRISSNHPLNTENPWNLEF